MATFKRVAKVAIGLIMIGAALHESWNNPVTGWLGFIPVRSAVSFGMDVGNLAWYVIGIWLIYSGLKTTTAAIKNN